MKLFRIFSILAIATLLIFVACRKEAKMIDLSPTASKTGPGNTASCLNYNVALARTFNGSQTTFIWTITNPSPGNGSNGTTQNLSHWSFVPGCPGADGLEQNWSDIIRAEYSYDGGTTWTVISPTPILKPDPSQTCSSANVFKFDFGTSGSTPTMYKMVVSGNYAEDANNFAIFKSGVKTGCCTRTVPGIGCKQEQNCSFSQGYWFGNGGHTWPGTVTIGGYSYTEAEGRAIWNCSNGVVDGVGGLRDSKKGFSQVAALLLSNAYPTGDAGIDADVATIQNWLATEAKLVGCTNLPNQSAAKILLYGNAAEAAGRIGEWIIVNHCP
jgi:hypothetical protein